MDEEGEPADRLYKVDFRGGIEYKPICRE